MDTNVAGLNKVVCFVNDATYNGRTVLITDSVNSWTKTVSELSCVFMIPSMPAPAKRAYTVSLMNSEGTAAQYSRQIELGFGDSVKIGLYENDEPVTKGTIPLATSTRTGGVRINDTTSNGIYLSGNNITLRNATSSQKGGVKVASSTSYGVRMNGDTLQTYDASSTQSGCIKIGAGLQVSSGVASVKYADASNVGGIKIGQGLQISSGTASIKAAGTSSSNKGGVYIQSGKGIILDSDGEIYLSYSYQGTIDISSSRTIASGKSLNVIETISDSTFISRMDRGFITGVDTDADIRSSIAYYKYNNGAYILYINLLNTSNSSKSMSKFTVYYRYFA